MNASSPSATARDAADDAPDLIDVLIPVFNGARWLRSAVQSIQHQTHAHLRIHVIDDGSTDETPSILARMASGDERLRVHRKANGGIVDALNHGLAHCTARWIARHDADDRADPQRLGLQLAYLRRHPACVAVSAVARHIDADGHALGTLTLLRPPGEADAHWCPAREPYLMHPLLLVRSDALRAVGGYRSVTHAEDSDLYWRLRERGDLHNLPDVLGDYRLHAGSLSSASVRGGRLMAIGSQLAALSARRRAAGRVDLPFDAARSGRLKTVAASLPILAALAGRDLTAQERPAFDLAVAAKLLELTAYQPFELEAEDCRFVRDAWARSAQALGAANRHALDHALTGAAARLCTAGRWGDAMAALPPPLRAAFALHLAVRIVLPDGLRRRLRALAARFDHRETPDGHTDTA